MTTAVETFMGIVDTMITTITGNSTLMVFFTAGIVFTAIAAVRKLKR